MFPIVKGIPVPSPRSNSLYPWGAMEVGDSFLAPLKKASSIATGCKKARLRYGGKFVYRTTPEGCRVWRVE